MFYIFRFKQQPLWQWLSTTVCHCVPGLTFLYVPTLHVSRCVQLRVSQHGRSLAPVVYNTFQRAVSLSCRWPITIHHPYLISLPHPPILPSSQVSIPWTSTTFHSNNNNNSIIIINNNNSIIDYTLIQATINNSLTSPQTHIRWASSHLLYANICHVIIQHFRGIVSLTKLYLNI